MIQTDFYIGISTPTRYCTWVFWKHYPYRTAIYRQCITIIYL